ncbi:MAG: hypothetical protein GX444_18560 [Myxococcales bacterium]|nr:hypothetical protein [Myxococcales bacterium]
MNAALKCLLRLVLLFWLTPLLMGMGSDPLGEPEATAAITEPRGVEGVAKKPVEEWIEIKSAGETRWVKFVPGNEATRPNRATRRLNLLSARRMNWPEAVATPTVSPAARMRYFFEEDCRAWLASLTVTDPTRLHGLYVLILFQTQRINDMYDSVYADYRRTMMPVGLPTPEAVYPAETLATLVGAYLMAADISVRAGWKLDPLRKLEKKIAASGLSDPMVLRLPFGAYNPPYAELFQPFSMTIEKRLDPPPAPENRTAKQVVGTTDKAPE